MIMIAPNMPGWIYVGNPWANYFIQDIIPFVDRTYRTLRTREHRGIWGYSKGGGDVIQLAFMRPDLFSVVGAGVAAYSLPAREFEQYDAVEYPIRFWIHHGRNDTLVPFANSERLVAFIKEKGCECVFESYDGDYFTLSLDIIERFLEYFSKFLGAPLVAVQPQGKLATTWGEMRRR
jgi:predicted esterase